MFVVAYFYENPKELIEMATKSPAKAVPAAIETYPAML